MTAQPNKSSAPQEVTIFQSGYATDELWHAALTAAVLHGHQVKAVMGDGTVCLLPPAGEMKEALA